MLGCLGALEQSSSRGADDSRGLQPTETNRRRSNRPAAANRRERAAVILTLIQTAKIDDADPNLASRCA
jgi:hypothetical protein